MVLVKRLIDQRWKEESVPYSEMWIKELSGVLHLEEIINNLIQKPDVYTNIWNTIKKFLAGSFKDTSNELP